jgi:serine/threonine-protein kinase RsbW
VSGAYPALRLGSYESTGPLGSASTATRTFRGTPASVPEARRFAAGVLAGCPAREVLLVCVSELCANAIAHTASGNGGVFTVAVDWSCDGLARVAVTDGGGSSVPSAGTAEELAEGGRGLAMVAACSSRWGYTDARPRRTVWAEASWPVGIPAGRHERPGKHSRGPSIPIPPDEWSPTPSGPAA